jgi:hypothetical protein
LILVQVFLSFRPKQDVISSGETTAVVHKNTPFPGILGGVSLVLGVGLYLANRSKPQE